MSFWIVLEGGGTRTDGVVLTCSGEVLAAIKEEGSNPLFIDREIAVGRICGMISRLVEKSGLKAGQLNGIYCFIPGLRHIANRFEELSAQYEISYYGDEIPALYGAFGDGPGIVVLAGTGSFAAGRDASGKMASTGGWGPLFGDYGSGYDIGRRVLSKAVQLYDSGRGDDFLARAVMRAYNISDMTELRGLQNNKSRLFDRAHIAALCKIAADAADAGDADAGEILSDAARELAKLAAQCAMRLGVQGTPFPCALAGGVKNIGSKIKEPFIKHLEKTDSKLYYVEPRYSEIIGACLYVQKLNSCTLTGDKLTARLKA